MSVEAIMTAVIVIALTAVFLLIGNVVTLGALQTDCDSLGRATIFRKPYVCAPLQPASKAL